MELLFKIFFYISAFIMVWAMVGYPVSLKIIGKIYKSRKNKEGLQPSVNGYSYGCST